MVELLCDEEADVGSLHQLDVDFVDVKVSWRSDPVVVSGREVQVRVLDTWAHNAGGHVLRCRVEQIELPRWLSKSSGYTTDPSLAVTEEPEPPPRTWVNTNAALARATFEVRRREQEADRANMTLGEQLDLAIAETRARGVDTARQERELAGRIQAIRNKGKRRAA